MQVFDTYIWISDMHIGILSLGRSTFDVEYAIEKLAAMYVVLEQSGHKISGSNLEINVPNVTMSGSSVDIRTPKFL